MKLTEEERKAITAVVQCITEILDGDGNDVSVIEREFLFSLRGNLTLLRFIPVEVQR